MASSSMDPSVNAMEATVDPIRDRSDSDTSASDTSSILAVPVTLRRQLSTDGEDDKNGVQTISSLDFSFLELDLDTIESNLLMQISTPTLRPEIITTLNLSGNQIKCLPPSIINFVGLEVLDIGQNQIERIDEAINSLTNLSTLIASNNLLSSSPLPKDFGSYHANNLKVLSLGGNQITNIPSQIYDLRALKSLYLGSNLISELSKDVKRLENLRILYLGGNCLTSIPTEVGNLVHLQALSLCENKLRTLPSSIANLRNLKSLALHKNLLTALPPEIVKLRGLSELSLRNNPLVSRFVKDFTFDVPSLLELSGRCIKVNKIGYQNLELPKHLVQYLETARRCVNSKCKGKLNVDVT